MKNYTELMLRLVSMVVVLVVVTGCVAYNGFSVTARAGDTVTFALGTLDNVKKADVQLAYYSDSNPGVPIDITSSVRSILRLYPDKTSTSYWEQTAGANGLETIKALIDFSSHGPWQTVAVVDLPMTLPAGTGHVKFTMGAGVNYPAALAKVDDVNVGLTILAHDNGSAMIGAAHDFGFRKYAFNQDTSVGDINKLEPLQQVVVRRLAEQNSSPAPVSAASYDLTFTVLDQSGTDVTSSLTKGDFDVVLDDSPLYIRSQLHLIWKKTNTGFNISIISPAEPINPDRIRFSVVLSNIDGAAMNGWSISTNSASLQTLTYYDNQGAVMSGPTPDIKVMYN